ncbi:hypothetical protein ASD8599_01486 [Ascidiaceihabitans donghaensis]|uniref:Uncharacterized protein n=1 Tax=Ascidiaceihabitans donghaensis TaxID=1510460 RepID=A0A2R8BCE4_9RHOB|nr:hypothetical protein [Ascidiaceihabitans donghaensis]SPH20745.1 hypothetical protein ASD8599_01486 [Ascidiaceihabitans donghaensis]
MLHRLRTHLAFFVVGLLLALPLHAQNFSCRIGTQPACLDYGDKVCSSNGKCVNRSSACFDQYQCNYEGFTCKSNVAQCVDEHSALVRKYNGLLSDYDDLLFKAKKLATKHDALNECLLYANTLEDFQACVIYQ